MRWKKIGKVIKASVGSTVFYESHDGKFQIESRKKPIPHANGIGYWLHTTYHLIYDGKEEEYDLLCNAKKAAERIAEDWN